MKGLRTSIGRTLEASPTHVDHYIELSDGGTTLVFRIVGDLDLETRDTVAPMVAAIALADAIVIDLADVTFCDSTGIAMLVGVYEKAAATTTSIAFRNLRHSVRRVFENAGVDTLFELIE